MSQSKRAPAARSALPPALGAQHAENFEHSSQSAALCSWSSTAHSSLPPSIASNPTRACPVLWPCALHDALHTWQCKVAACRSNSKRVRWRTLGTYHGAAMSSTNFVVTQGGAVGGPAPFTGPPPARAATRPVLPPSPRRAGRGNQPALARRGCACCCACCAAAACAARPAASLCAITSSIWDSARRFSASDWRGLDGERPGTKAGGG